MVQFKKVSKIYNGNISAVKDVSFSVEEGEFLFLIGPSGSGKTTVIKMLIRDEIPTTGNIFFKDIDITKLKRRKVYQLRREIGVVFQDYKLVPDKNVFENVAFAMEAAGKKDKEIKETVPYVLDIVGLENRIKSFPKELSGGEQQRVAIARAIANNPKILIADEPTGNLDPASSWDIVQVLTKINSWGTTIIMSTHGTEIVNSLNKRVIQMHNGSVIRDDNKGQYEMTGNYESSVLIATDKFTNPFSKEDPETPSQDAVVQKPQKNKKKSKPEKDDTKNANAQKVSQEETQDKSSDMIDLHITLGHKGVRIPVKKAKKQKEPNSENATEATEISNSTEAKSKEIADNLEGDDSAVSSEEKGISKKESKALKKKSTWFDSLKVSDDIKKILKEIEVSSYEEFIEEGLEKLETHEGVDDNVLEEIAHALEEEYTK